MRRAQIPDRQVTHPVSLTNRAHHILRTRVSEHPAIYLPFARRKYPGPSPEVIGAETQLVIDGYTRSATTFAVYCVQLAQDRPIRLAHHLHASAQLIEAARRGVPALALIREPEGAVLSQMIRDRVHIRDATAAYARFYERLMPLRDRFVAGEFEDVTNDFARVVRRLNHRFGLALNEPQPGAESLALELMKLRPTLADTLLRFESGTATIDQVRAELPAITARASQTEDQEKWVPSEHRRRQKIALREQWQHPTMAGLRRRAEAAYRSFVGGSDR